MPERFVIVGASLAGATAAATLRAEGFDGQVTLIGEEREAPYERPPLSKQYLRGGHSFDKALVRPQGFYAAEGIDLRAGIRATRIEPAAKTIVLTDGGTVAYDKLLITTGSRNRRLSVPSADLQGIYDLRRVSDADRIRAEAASARRAAIVGMGFIGCEVAASLRQLGVDVTVIERAKAPLHRALGEEVGLVLEGIHRDHGVDVILQDAVARFEGEDRVEALTTQLGRRVDCDFAVFGIGVEPVTDVVAGSGIDVDNGIVVDEHCRTSIEGIYAAGDVTNHYHPVAARRMRVEHWQNALSQGAAAARSMLGKGEPYDEVPWFWSDQYDYGIHYAGFPGPWDELVVRGSLDDREFVVFYLKDRSVLACAGVNRPRDVRRSMPLIKARSPVEPRQLEDQDVDLRQLQEVSRW